MLCFFISNVYSLYKCSTRYRNDSTCSPQPIFVHALVCNHCYCFYISICRYLNTLRDMLAENRRHIFLVRKTIIAIHPKLSKFLFSLLKLLFYDKISRRQHEQCSNTSDVFLALREKYGEDAALSLIYINLKFLGAEKALECFEGVSIPSVDIEQTPYDILLRDIVQIVLIVGEERVEELICYLAKVYLDDPHPDHVREWGVLGVFSQLIDRANIVPENGTDLLINSVEQVFDDRAILERCRDCVENDLTSCDEGELCHVIIT